MRDNEEVVILVDSEDKEIGIEKKLRAHEEGILHRAFSIYIFDSGGKLLLQKRAQCKYHSGGLWSNACCGHPRPGEDVLLATHRRLREELGFDCELREIPNMIYRAELPSGMIEHEFLHIFTGNYFKKEMAPDPQEVEMTKWTGIHELENDLKENPNHYTAWFNICLPHVLKSSKK